MNRMLIMLICFQQKNKLTVLSIVWGVFCNTYQYLTSRLFKYIYLSLIQCKIKCMCFNLYFTADAEVGEAQSTHDPLLGQGKL